MEKHKQIIVCIAVMLAVLWLSLVAYQTLFVRNQTNETIIRDLPTTTGKEERHFINSRPPYSTDEINRVLKDATKDEVRELLGIPQSIGEVSQGETWAYTDIAYHPLNGQQYETTVIFFRGNLVDFIRFW